MMSRTMALIVPAAVAAVSIPTQQIADGVFMPIISIGDGGEETGKATLITSTWLSLGGRGIDTATDYGNQQDVGKVVANSGIAREEIFITTKIPFCNGTDFYVQQSLRELNVSYIDLLLIHFPSELAGGDCGIAWATLEEYHAQGKLKAIGVSHFNRSDLQSLMKTAKVTPHVNQVLLNVLEYDADQIAASAELGVHVEGYCPLGRRGIAGDIPGNPTIQKVAAAHNVSTYQIAIKWILQNGHSLVFQSSNPAHQTSDSDVFGFNMTDSEMLELNALQAGKPTLVV